ncbi:thioredoxin-dependent thiol peroxidase [Corynebacterium caspium]|uniref:thioredoxin-dependent thiol peroxidase n=1 Tax=Corynebacterium caspium TaxID=234828 RepID=UPI0004754922|nr:thioredoxin-dependent thiol peroxidase [Corynebacterium caspium]WKD58806.1 Putative peroxiredoxin [Corynebacterium caspium DSM 44850]
MTASNETEPQEVQLKVGDKAPNFTLPSDTGEMVSLSDYAGQRVVVYFYPRANTPGCTKEACDFRDNLALLNEAGVQVIGISPDPVERLAGFREKQDLNFPLLGDPEKTVMRQWGAYGKKKNYGKLIQGTIRSTFLVDAQGNIEAALYNIKATGHVARLIRDHLKL